MQDQSEKFIEKSVDSPKPIYFRALICCAAVGMLFINVDWSTPPFQDALLQFGLALLLLIYIPLSYQLVRWRGTEKAPQTEHWLSFSDAGLIGMLIALANFTLLPTLLLVTIVQFNALAQGGGRHWLGRNGALLAGVSLGYLLHRPTFVVHPELNISTLSLIVVCIYFCAYAFYTNKQLGRLKVVNRNLIKVQRETDLASYTLSKYLPRRLWRAVTKGRKEDIVTERKLLTVFFSDIKDFSRLTEEMEAEMLTRLLNHYLTEMSRIVAHYGGTIDKFIGDAVMVVFGDDQSQGPKSDALRCVTMALAMRKRVREMMQEWYDQGISHHLQVRMGINTGNCTAGVFGAADHQTYTVVGAHVNLAARLESAAEPGEVLISHDTWALVKQTVMCRDKGHVAVKGFSAPVKVYQVTDLRKNLGSQQSYIEEHAPGFSMHLDLDKVRNYDKDKILQSLQKAAAQLKSKEII